MEAFELQDFNKRIGLNTDLKNISLEICKRYDNMETENIVNKVLKEPKQGALEFDN